MAIVAHHEKLSGGNNEIAFHHVAREFDGPGIGSAVVGIAISLRRDGRKLVKKPLVVCGRRRLSVGLWLFISIDVDDAVVEMNVVAGYANQSLDQEKDRRLTLGIDRSRFDEHHDVAALGLAI